MGWAGDDGVPSESRSLPGGTILYLYILLVLVNYSGEAI